ncbi:transcription initiation factor IIB [Haloprofundus halophilus]|uniref:transcription initiation factor IIB n=1 Tax=Haloprofundus halophilus TaxID=2283527 RepID=UPI000E44CEBF|nr:transcription initiation factor IIB family protein [Haloprofundus halophilus]
MTTRNVYTTTFDESNGQTIQAEHCPECDGRLRTEGGEHQCSECGLIVNEYWIANASKPRVFSSEERSRKRTGAPLTVSRHDRGLSTEIGYKTDGYGKTLSGKKRREFGRLRKQQSRARFDSKQKRNLAHGFGEIKRMASALGVDKSVTEFASQVFRTAQKENLLVGRSIESMTAASLYAACRCTKVTRTLDEVARAAACRRGRVKNDYKVLNAELGLATAVQRPKQLVPRIASSCNISRLAERRALELADIAWSEGLANGRAPSGIAAACIYMAVDEFGEAITQAEIAETAGTSPVTLRGRYAELQGVGL